MKGGVREEEANDIPLMLQNTVCGCWQKTVRLIVTEDKKVVFHHLMTKQKLQTTQMKGEGRSIPPVKGVCVLIFSIAT